MSDWDEVKLAKLRELWSKGVSTAEIGRRLDISKNSVVGKAHRLYLPSRPSPIPERREPRESGPKRLGKTSSLPALACATEPELPAYVPPILRPEELTVAKSNPGAKPCCWPIGDPKKASFHFCNAAAHPGRPYCDDHAAMAYAGAGRREHAA